MSYELMWTSKNVNRRDSQENLASMLSMKRSISEMNVEHNFKMNFVNTERNFQEFFNVNLL